MERPPGRRYNSGRCRFGEKIGSSLDTAADGDVDQKMFQAWPGSIQPSAMKNRGIY